jgi:UDP-N-acetylglucosamine 4,6-dehydratase
VNILITGGTGSFGRAVLKELLYQNKYDRIIIFSRDELKQHELQQMYPEEKYPTVRFFLGDVRDVKRLKRALTGVDYVIHAAALKQVPAAEYNPTEAIKTNITGAVNLIEACIDCGVKKVIALSTDKAVNPINLYGATKLCMEKLLVAGNHYSGKTLFSVVRYGNVAGSRGSVIPLFKKQAETGCLTVTHPDMTRFWITLDKAVEFVLLRLGDMRGGEIFVPMIPSMNMLDLAETMAPDANITMTGIRPGEKMHETLISKDDAHRVSEFDDYYTIHPDIKFFGAEQVKGENVPPDFEYTSNGNTWRMTEEDLRRIL